MLPKYKNFHGLEVELENPSGTRRAGRGRKLWFSDMKLHYGFLPNTLAVDGDEIDVFLPNGNDYSEKVFVIHQRVRDTEEYDEDKVMAGFHSKEDAIKAYASAYDDYTKYLGPITEWDVKDLVKALQKSKGNPGKLDSTAKRKWLESRQQNTLKVGFLVMDYIRGKRPLL